MKRAIYLLVVNEGEAESEEDDIKTVLINAELSAEVTLLDRVYD